MPRYFYYASRDITYPEGENDMETDFHTRADATLDAFEAALEPYDQDGTLELERSDDALSLSMASGKVYLISKHAASQQVWVASPLSGGLHFRAEGTGWVLPDGQRLEALVAEELSQLSGVIIRL